ncbi:Zinc finger protein [Trichinella spiralis]|uniref:Zinc finger protein n=1 Tax=Trichinella spiralis TaxID=6334 RepID=A0ABR3KXE1_TRISP
MTLDRKSLIFMKKVAGLPVLMRQQNHMIDTLSKVRDEHFRTSTAGSSITKTTSSVRKILSHESGCQFTCPYEGSKLHFDTLSKVKIVRMFTLNIVTS